MLNIENFENKFKKIVNSKDWKKVEDVFRDSKLVFVFGNGGNLAIADHAAVDISRLTDKNCIAPGSGITATSIIGDSDALSWFESWLKYRFREIDLSKACVICFSCSTNGTSSEASVRALNYAANLGVPSILISAQPKYDLDPRIISVSQDVTLYHTSEIMSLALTYQLTHSSGFECPSIIKKARQRRFEALGIETEVKEVFNQNVPPGFENELKNLAIDFDGVIHNFDKGWHDGTCYGDPIPGSIDAIKKLSEHWNIIIFSSKVRPDRPLVNGKTGLQLVEEWLKKHNIYDCVIDVTHEKPRAEFYVDDKAIEFKNNWTEVLSRIKK